MQTQAQQFAAKYAAKLAKRQLRAIAIVSILSKLITFGVAIISFRHQSSTLVHWNAPIEIAYGLPGLVDLLTIVCVLGISTPAMRKEARKYAGRVVIIPMLVSAAINGAGVGSTAVKLTALSLPFLIPLGEIVGSAMRPDFAEMDRIERAAYAVATPDDPDEVDELTRERRSEAARKAAKTRAEKRKAEAERKAQRAAKAAETRAQRKAQDDLEETYAMAEAPVSPAPVGQQ